MSYNIFYNHLLESKISFEKREELSILKISKNNFKLNRGLIKESIDTFHSEIKWEEMWDLYDCEIRLLQNQILYLLLENIKPIGHVWYEGNYLYNAFVSKQRYNGDSPWFIQETMWDMKENSNITSIKLYTDSWNIRAQQFWKKLGYEKLT
jgi:hypothetical protein